jgi:Fe-S-cluster-containing dehydrogenase component
MQCVHACSLTKEGVCSHELARIQMAEGTNYCFDNAAKPCLQCVDPQCMRSCPTGAIRVDAATGGRIIVEKSCMGCQNCIQNCPYTPPRIRFNKAKKKAVKCDLCGGDPACVKACPQGALTYFTDPQGIQTGYIQPKGSI